MENWLPATDSEISQCFESKLKNESSDLKAHQGPVHDLVFLAQHVLQRRRATTQSSSGYSTEAPVASSQKSYTSYVRALSYTPTNPNILVSDRSPGKLGY
jgi:hypothetical protein